MSGIVPKFSGGPVTFQVSAKVTGGQVVKADASPAKTVSPAGAGSALVLGVALTDAIPTETGVNDDFGNAIVPTNAYPQHTTVAGPGFVVPVTYAANADFGALLKSAANGTVTPWVSGTDAAGLIIGRCFEPGGVVIATKATGDMRVGN